jgi:HSP20 family protein
MVWQHRTPFSLFTDIDRLASAAIDRMARVAWPEAEADVDAPRANVHLTERAAGVELLVPGYGPEHVQVTVEGRRLVVKGERKEGEGDAAKVVASFERSLELPFEIDGDKVEAKLEYGVLRLSLPKLVQSPARVISVR